MLYIIVGSFFTMNLFVGVVIEAFNSQKAEKEGDQIEKSLFADEDQKKWMKTQALLLKLGALLFLCCSVVINIKIFRHCQRLQCSFSFLHATLLFLFFFFPLFFSSFFF